MPDQQVPRLVTNLLLTGPPGCGKTTVLWLVVNALKHYRLAGFYTRNIRQRGQRVGFRVVGLRGQQKVLAHVDLPSDQRVGRYGVVVEGLEMIAQDELSRPHSKVDLFVIDEIGKMECLSQLFIQAARSALESPVPVLATVAASGGGFIKEAKQRPDVEILTVTPENRQQLVDELVARLFPT